YFALPAAVKLEIQAKIGFTDYYEVPYAKKVEIQKLREVLMMKRELNKTVYTGGLTALVLQGYLAPKTQKKFLKDFAEISTAEQQEWLEALGDKNTESEIGKRIH